MNERKELGKIERFEVGFGGYQDAMFGVSIELGGKGWGVGDFKGAWAHKPDKYTKWTKDDQRGIFADAAEFIIATLRDAKKDRVSQLVGVPVEVVFEGNTLKSWRVLKEVL